MIFLWIAFLLAPLIAGAATDGLTRSTATEDFVPEGYTLANVTWTIPLTPGGQNHTFQGTVQEVFVQLNDLLVSKGLPPRPEPIDNTTSFDAELSAIRAELGHGLNARTFDHTICQVPLPGVADGPAILSGIRHLNTVGTQCRMEGPGACGRISCSYNSAIYWCNDKNGYQEFPCSYFSQYVGLLLGLCAETRDSGFWGQTFDTDQFNVYIGSGPRC
ncbi:hypothetical protein F5Y18DRAFT_410680 [Xylariaceae sp. FL1019]|nr:hypothetical protein F5Y18DRAFT_410680 [Xylariaceae sp. FL1019]